MFIRIWHGLRCLQQTQSIPFIKAMVGGYPNLYYSVLTSMRVTLYLTDQNMFGDVFGAA